MAIRFDDKTKTFHLDTKNTTYQMKVDDYGFLLHLYYGQKTVLLCYFIGTGLTGEEKARVTYKESGSKIEYVL